MSTSPYPALTHGPQGGVFRGDARNLADLLPDASVDLVLTDPVYDQIDDYAWLAEVAARVLKPDTAVLTFASKQHLPLLRQVMGVHLDYVWTLDYVLQAKTSRLWAYNVFTWNTPCLWHAQGRGYPLTTIPDTFVGSNGRVDGRHRWNKNLAVLKYWINAFTVPGALVWDPFCGGGSTLVAAKETGRFGVGFERDAHIAMEARERVAGAALPLLVQDGGRYQLSFEGFEV
jgi:adenine-specific DNA-methyltransferase